MKKTLPGYIDNSCKQLKINGNLSYLDPLTQHHLVSGLPPSNLTMTVHNRISHVKEN